MSSRAWTPPNSRRSLNRPVRKHLTKAETGRESFPCQHVCGECGWLADLADASCPACESSAWIDLSHITTAETLREHERDNPTLSRSQRRWLNLGTGTSLLTWAGACGALVFAGLPLGAGVALAACGVMAALPLRKAVIENLANRVRETLAARRRLALPPAEAVTGQLRGYATPEATLRSPLGDVPCLAWRVRAVLRNSDHDGLMIDDSRSAAFEVANHAIETDSVELAEAGSSVELHELEGEARERAARFLRARGCFSHEGEWLLEERVIPLGVPVRVEGRGSEAAPTLHEDSGEGLSPYR